MKKKILCGILAMALACSLYGCGSSGAATTVSPNTTEAAAASDLPEMTFSIGHTGTEDSWNQSMCLKIKEKLEEYSGGKIKVNVYANAQMGSDSEMILSVIQGDLTMQCTNTASVTNTVSDCGIADLPFLFDNVESVRKVLSDETFLSLLKEKFEAQDLALMPGCRCVCRIMPITLRFGPTPRWRPRPLPFPNCICPCSRACWKPRKTLTAPRLPPNSMRFRSM